MRRNSAFPKRLDKPEPTNVNNNAGRTWEKVVETQCPQDRLLSNHPSRMARRYFAVAAPSVGCAIARIWYCLSQRSKQK